MNRLGFYGFIPQKTKNLIKGQNSAIHQINHYPVYNVRTNQLYYSLHMQFIQWIALSCALRLDGAKFRRLLFVASNSLLTAAGLIQ